MIEFTNWPEALQIALPLENKDFTHLSYDEQEFLRLLQFKSEIWRWCAIGERDKKSKQIFQNPSADYTTARRRLTDKALELGLNFNDAVSHRQFKRASEIFAEIQSLDDIYNAQTNAQIEHVEVDIPHRE